MRKLFFILTMMVSLLVYQTEAKKMALLIAVQDYPGISGWTTLHSREDIKLLKGPLEDSGFTVSTLIDGAATHKGIINAIGKFTEKCAPGDMVLIHFSGHGQQMPDLVGDEKDHKTEAFIPYDAKDRPTKGYNGENHLTDDEIREALIPIRNKLTKTGHLLVTFDACHSADMARGDEDEFNESDSLITRSLPFFKKGKPFVRNKDIILAKNAANVIEISACDSTESNYEYRNQSGSLSYLLSLGIKKQGKNLDFLKLAQFVINKDNYRSIMTRQTPCCHQYIGMVRKKYKN